MLRDDSRNFLAFVGWSLLTLTLASSCDAQVVRIFNGQLGWAQGWLFLDTDGRCKVVTAGHVAKTLDGSPARGLKAVDTHGREIYLDVPEIISASSKDPDIAILPAPVGDISYCVGRLSAIGADRRIASGAATIIETTHKTEWVRVPVRQLANQIDRSGGELFSVELTGADEVAEGWSGSVVMDVEGPLGIVFAVQGEKVALAVRVDVIRKLLNSKRTEVGVENQRAARPAQIVLLAGSTPDSGFNPDSFLLGNGQWRVVPNNGRIAFALYYRQPIHLNKVRLTISGEGGNLINGMDVATSDSATPDEWQSLNYCRAGASGGALACAANAAVDRIRITVSSSSGDPLTLSSLMVE